MISFEPSHRQTAYLSDVGQVRSENQDACAEFCDPVTGAQLLVVADGMGGHQGGATASRMAIEAVGEVFQSAQVRGPDMLVEALSTANERIFDAAAGHSELRGMGTTCVALLISRDGSSWVAHVGDSRAYQLRNGELHPITGDHSAVAELQRRGMITAAEAEVHPRRNELLRSIGVEPDVEVEVNPVEIAQGDQFLLCSDGLSGVVRDPEIAAVINERSPAESVRVLVDSANARGGPDNITVMITSFAGNPAPAVAGYQGAPDSGSRAGSRSRNVRLLTAFAVLVAALLVATLIVLLATSDRFSAEMNRSAHVERLAEKPHDSAVDPPRDGSTDAGIPGDRFDGSEGSQRTAEPGDTGYDE
jgi:protein phosphatase